MRIIQWEDLPDDAAAAGNGLAATIGVFDGVHLGHRLLIDGILRQRDEFVPTVFSFRQNPKAVLHPESYSGDILSLRQKIGILADLGVQLLVLIDFSGDFSKLAGKEFIGLLQDRGNLRYLTVGSNFRCGRGLDTDAGAIQALNGHRGIITEIVEPLERNGNPVSSSRVRAAIVAGDLVEAAGLLGRNVAIDLAGMPRTPGDGGVDVDVRASGRIAPPTGRYPAMLYLQDGLEPILATVSIDNGRLRIPGGLGASRVEFLSAAQDPKDSGAS